MRTAQRIQAIVRNSFEAVAEEGPECRAHLKKQGVADFSATPCCNSDTGLLPKKVIYYSPLCF